jgi:hypothetical protein
VLKALVMLLLVTGTMADAISQARKRAEREQEQAFDMAQQARRSVWARRVEVLAERCHRTAAYGYTHPCNRSIVLLCVCLGVAVSQALRPAFRRHWVFSLSQIESPLLN